MAQDVADIIADYRFTATIKNTKDESLQTNFNQYLKEDMDGLDYDIVSDVKVGLTSFNGT